MEKKYIYRYIKKKRTLPECLVSTPTHRLVVFLNVIPKHLLLFIFCVSATEFIQHNMDKLSRIYPAGTRTDSSNYSPVTMWNAGCQIGDISLRFMSLPSLKQKRNVHSLSMIPAVCLVSDVCYGATVTERSEGYRCAC